MSLYITVKQKGYFNLDTVALVKGFTTPIADSNDISRRIQLNFRKPIPPIFMYSNLELLSENLCDMTYLNCPIFHFH